MPLDAKMASPSPSAASDDVMATRLGGEATHPVRSLDSKSWSMHMCEGEADGVADGDEEPDVELEALEL